MNQDIGNPVVIKHLYQVVADAGLVVVDIAGGKDRHFAGCLGAVAHRMRA